MSFANLGLSAQVLDAIKALGYDQATPIQQQAIPAIIEGRDVMAAAQTGTGKTAGFTLPLIENLSKGNKPAPNQVRALILTPTRELAAQVAESVEKYSKNLRLRSDVVYGGVKINPQMMRLRKGTDVLVATPGRLLDLLNQNAVKFSQLETLVLDEADRMLDMGFIHDIKKLLKAMPQKRQNLMFSATFSDEIRTLAKGLIHDPVEISVTPKNQTAKTVEQVMHPVDKSRKSKLLIHLIKQQKWQQVLVFTRTKHGANRLVRDLEGKKISAAAIHGNKSQSARTKALAGFKDGSVNILVATDIVARGLDIDQLPQVVNFDLPNQAEDYVHRIGRTGRAGASGHAISFVTAACLEDLMAIERLTQALIPRQEVEGFEPVNKVPETKLDTRPFKAKKPKKPKKPKPEQNQSSKKQGTQQNKSQEQKPAHNKPHHKGKKPKQQTQGNKSDKSVKKKRVFKDRKFSALREDN